MIGFHRRGIQPRGQSGGNANINTPATMNTSPMLNAIFRGAASRLIALINPIATAWTPNANNISYPNFNPIFEEPAWGGVSVSTIR